MQDKLKREKPDQSQASQKVENHYHFNFNLAGWEKVIAWLIVYFLF